jgi:hypothetical protein
MKNVHFQMMISLLLSVSLLVGGMVSPVFSSSSRPVSTASSGISPKALFAGALIACTLLGGIGFVFLGGVGFTALNLFFIGLPAGFCVGIPVAGKLYDWAKEKQAHENSGMSPSEHAEKVRKAYQDYVSAAQDGNAEAAKAAMARYSQLRTLKP